MLTSQLVFHKLHGAGNDFVVLDALTHPLNQKFDFPGAAIALCDRHFGVGSDGLLTLEKSTDGADLRMRMWNPDGSQDMCGNGLRCVAALAWRLKHVQKPEFSVQTLSGRRQIRVLRDDLISATMGEPLFEPHQVPILWSDASQNALDIQIPVGNRTFRASTLSTGSTHTVIFLKNPLSEADFQTLSPQLETHSLFPKRTSLMWAVADGESRFKIRIWERGAGETLACGTGACAVAVAAQLMERAQGIIDVESRGGTLHVEWSPGREIVLTGPARYVFQGLWKL